MEDGRVKKPPLNRSISQRSHQSAALSTKAPPDGGLYAWTQVLMAHLVVFNSWGYINSFGVFETYYASTLGRTTSEISWLGSVQIFLLFGIGVFSGRALDYGKFRTCFAVGILFQTIGVFMTSLSTEYYQLFLAQALCTGIGHGLVFCPVTSLVATYFTSHKSMAMALAACGTATGGLVYPAMVRQLLPMIGFGWTVRALGLVQLTLNLVALASLRTRLPPRVSGPLVDWSAFSDMTYTLFIAGMFLLFWALYFAFFYIGTFATDVLGLSYTESVNLLFILNGTGVPARLIPAWIADRYTGPLNLLVPIGLGSSVVMFAWAAITPTDVTGAYIWIVFYGLVTSGIQSLWPTTLAVLTEDPKRTGTRMGMGFSVISFACLSGPPIAGALIQQNNGGYLYAQIWGGTSLLLGMLVLVAARWARVGWKLDARI